MKYDITIEGLNLANAAVAMAASSLAYEQPTVSDPTLDVHIRLIEQEDAVIVAFRGTASLKDFITDARALRMGASFRRASVTEPYSAHIGFLNGWAEIKTGLSAVLWSKLQGRKLVVTGHSLGGAFAVLCALWICELGHGDLLRGVYTFGQPRVMDKRGAKLCQQEFGEKHFRFEDDLDCITRIPGWLIGYRHSGHNVFLPATGGYTIDPLLIFKILSDAFAIWQARNNYCLLLGELLDDHYRARYTLKIQGLLHA